MAYIQKNNPLKSSPCRNCGTSPLHQPKVNEDIDWDNLTDAQKKAMNLQPEVEVARYGVDVTRYKNFLENRKTTMLPGHIQASIANTESKKVRGDLGIKKGDPTQVNAWYTGNEPVYRSTKLKEGERYKDEPAYETQRVYLKKDQAKQFLDIAKTIKPTKDPRTFERDGKTYTIPLGDEGYDFIRNNCAKGVCEALGVNPDKARRKSKVKYVGGVGGIILDTLINKVMTDGGITEPKKAWDIIMKKFNVDET
jgi:hypothetical protein